MNDEYKLYTLLKLELMTSRELIFIDGYTFFKSTCGLFFSFPFFFAE